MDMWHTAQWYLTITYNGYVAHCTMVPHDNLQWMWHTVQWYRTITYNGYVAHCTMLPHDNLQWMCGTLYIGTARLPTTMILYNHVGYTKPAVNIVTGKSHCLF